MTRLPTISRAVRRAFARSGQPCAEDRPQQVAAAPEPQPVQTVGVRSELRPSPADCAAMRRNDRRWTEAARDYYRAGCL